MLLFHIFEATVDTLNTSAIKKYSQQLVDRAKQDHSYKGEQTPEAIANQLLMGDPQNGKNLIIIIKWYIFDKNKNKHNDDIDRGPFLMEDIKSKVLESIKKFLRLKPKLAKKDLGQYPSIHDLWNAIDEYDIDSNVSNKQLEKNAKSHIKRIIDTPDFKVIIPLTMEASQFYGKGTKWCTAAEKDSMFEHYNSQGPLYYIFAGTGDKVQKFAIHFETETFMNAKDVEVSKTQIKYLSGFPKYKELLEMLIEKHYGDSLKAYDKLKAEGKIK